MNGKKSKIIRKLAKRLAQENQTYLTKTSTKVFTDLQNNKIPYTTDQTVLHPMSAKSIGKMLKGMGNLALISAEELVATVSLQCEAKLAELKVNGYS